MKSDKTVLNILENFLDEHAGESAWEDAEKAINAHALTVAERLIPDEKVGTIKIPLNDIERGYNLAIQDVTTAFRKEYGENDV